MPKETIRRLSDDVARVLVAGAHLAPADPELKRDHEALVALAKQVGARAPVIGKLADSAGKALSGSGKAAAAELLGLATTTAQVRAAQAAAAAPVGALLPLAEVPRVPTTCNGKDLDELRAALVEKGQGRKEVIARAIEGGYIADLRLVEALIYAMGDAWVGDVVSDQAIPALGRAVVNPIRRHLTIKGGTALDARRLRALVAVEKQEALDVLSSAVREGSAPVREAAMDAIADHVSGVPEFEPYALEAIAKDRATDIKRAAIRALAGYASDASLEALLTALDEQPLAGAAAEALGRSKNPRAVEKLLARLGEAVAAARPPARKPKDEAPDLAEARSTARAAAELVLSALRGHSDPAIARAGLELLDAYGAAAGWAVVGSADRPQLERLAGLLGGSDAALFPVAVAAAVRLGPAESFERLSGAFAAKGLLQRLKTDKQRGARMDAVLAHFSAHPSAVDRPWCDCFLALLQDGPADQARRVVGVLGQARERRAVPRLVALLAAEKKPETLVAIIQALGQIGDAAALDPILERVSVKGARYAIQEAVLAIDDRSAVDKVRSIYVHQKNPEAWENWPIRSLLRTLEQRFPGS